MQRQVFLSGLWNDLNLHLGRNVAMELDRGGIYAQCSNLFVELDFSPVDLEAFGLQNIGDLLGRNGPEDPALLSDACRNDDIELLELFRQFPRVVNQTLEAVRRLPPDFLDLFYIRGRGQHRESARDQIIPTIPALHVHDITRVSQRIDVLLKNDFHLLVQSGEVPQIHRSSGLAKRVSHKGNQRHVSCALDGTRHLTLMLGARTGNAPRKQFPLIVQITLKLIRILKVDVLDTGFIELTLPLLAMLARRCDVSYERFSLRSLL